MTEPQSASPTSIEIHRELERKALHLPGLAVPWLYHNFSKLTVVALGALCLAYYLSELRRTQGRDSLPVIGYLSKKLTRSTHLDLAPIYLTVGLVTISVYFPLKAAMGGALLVCLCDAIAAVVGMKFGRRRIPLLKKTYLGTMAFFLSAVLVLLLILDWRHALLTAAIATFIEAISIEGIDNLMLPLIGGILVNYFL